MFRLGIVFAIICAALAFMTVLALPRVHYQPPLDTSNVTKSD